MTNQTRRRAAFLIVFLLMLTIPVHAEAYSRGVYYRPAVTFVASNAPSDLMLRIDFERNGEVITEYLYKETRFWESWYRFYRQTAQGIHIWYGNRADFKNAMLVAETGGREIQIPLPEDIRVQLTMNDFFMLDATDYSIHFGLSRGRAILLFFLRLVITLSISLAVLYFFRYRRLRSWRVVLITNLICQGGLSLMLVNQINFHPGLIAVQFLAMVGVFVIQIPLFCWLLDENGSDYSVTYSLWSNLATGVVNSFLLTSFPL